MSNWKVNTTWYRTYKRNLVEYRPEGGWDGSSACKAGAQANSPKHPSNSFGGYNTRYCYHDSSHCTAVSQPSTPPSEYDPVDYMTNYTDGTKASYPPCPYDPVYNPGSAQQRTQECPGDGQATNVPLWNAGAPGAWKDSGKTTPVTWKFTSRYKYCAKYEGPPSPGAEWQYIQGLTQTLKHPLEERKTPETMNEARLAACNVTCYP